MSARPMPWLPRTRRGGRVRLAAALVSAAASAVPARASAAAPGTPEPPEPLRQTDVFAQARLNGHPLSTRALSFSEPAAVALARIRARWQAVPGTPVVTAARDGWRIASRITGDGIETVQLRDRAPGSDGFRTLWPRPPAAARPPQPDWLPPDARLLQAVESADTGRHGTTVTAALPTEPAAAMAALLRQLAARGWVRDELTAHRLSAAAAPARAGHGALLRRGPQELLVSVAPAPGGAALVAHLAQVRP